MPNIISVNDIWHIAEKSNTIYSSKQPRFCGAAFLMHTTIIPTDTFCKGSIFKLTRNNQRHDLDNVEYYAFEKIWQCLTKCTSPLFIIKYIPFAK